MKTKLLLLLSFFSLNLALAQEFTDLNGIKYNITSPTAVEVIANSPIYTGSITILAKATDPSTSIEYDVTGIAVKAFYKCTTLTSIVIPASVAYIGEAAFYECTSLTSSITIPVGVTVIEDETFYKCTKIASISVPEGVLTIGESAFYRCEAATSLNIPTTVTSIGEAAFDQCKKVTNFVIPNGVTRIENNTFNKCTSLTSITIPTTVNFIGDNAFTEDAVLANITIPNAVTSIGANAFYKCRAMTSVNIPNVISIGTKAFQYLDALTDVTVGAVDPASITLGATVWLLADVTTATLNVPLGSEVAYDVAAQWIDFGTTVGVVLSTNNSVLESSFSVYPNPVQNTLYITQNESYELEQVNIINVQGQNVLSSSNSSIDVSNLAKGVYFVKISTSLGSTTKKLIKN